MSARVAAIAACALLAASVVLTPWYALADYVPNGWDATWWARAAVLAALAAIVALRLRRDMAAALLAALGLVCVVVRTAAPPDFGFAFDGLSVPVERRWGLWLALAAAVMALAASAQLARSGAGAPPGERAR